MEEAWYPVNQPSTHTYCAISWVRCGDLLLRSDGDDRRFLAGIQGSSIGETYELATGFPAGRHEMDPVSPRDGRLAESPESASSINAHCDFEPASCFRA